MKKLWLALLLSFAAFPAWAQNPQCPTRSFGDSSNACASTAFVQNAILGAVVSVSNVDGSLTISPTTGNVVASINFAHNNTWTGSNIFTDIYTQIDQPSWDVTLTRFGHNSSTGADSFTIFAGLNIAAVTGSSVDYEKFAGLFWCQTVDPSTTHLLDCGGIDGRGYIASNNALGRAWGGYFRAQIVSGGTGDGKIVAGEFHTINNGTSQSSVATTTSKYGLYVVADGTNPTTAGMLFDRSNSQTYFNIIYAEPGVLNAATSKFLNLNGIFSVDKSGLILGTAETLTGAGASILAVGRQGATNPVLQVDASTATVATGLKLKGAAAAGGMAVSVITSGTDENLTIDAAGAGTIAFGNTSTGSILVNRTLASIAKITQTASITSGAGFAQAITQTSANAGDTGDAAYSMNYTLTATNANELIARVFYLNITNNLTNAKTLSNARGLDITLSTNASTTTSNMYHIYLENGTSAGTVTIGYAMWIDSVQGTTKWGIYDNAQVSHYLGGLSLGTTTQASAGNLLVNGTVTLTNLATDATHTDRTVCQDTTSKTLFFGSGAAGICLGTSGRQFKTEFKPMVVGLKEVVAIPLWNYRYRDGYGDNGARMQYGPTAQDVEVVLPDLAGHNDRGETINYDWGALVFISLKAIQELKADNDNLRAELARVANGR